jgi:hypothetical protein
MQALHREFLRLPPDWKEQSGALGLNLKWEQNPQQPWFIEYQHLGGDFVAAGLAMGRDEVVDWGLKILAWGFGQISPDGSFNHPDRYHSASFFVESASRAFLLLESAPQGKKWVRDAERWKPKLRQAAQWMARPDVHADNWPDPALIETKWGERRYGHRREDEGGPRPGRCSLVSTPIFLFTRPTRTRWSIPRRAL